MARTGPFHWKGPVQDGEAASSHGEREEREEEPGTMTPDRDRRRGDDAAKRDALSSKRGDSGAGQTSGGHRTCRGRGDEGSDTNTTNEHAERKHQDYHQVGSLRRCRPWKCRALNHRSESLVVCREALCWVFLLAPHRRSHPMLRNPLAPT